ncbi:NTPase [Chloroflexota bacterium]
MAAKKACFLSGRPGSGKTTVIKEVLSRGEKSAGGFYTEEIRIQGVREGFRIITLEGKSAVLAHVGICSRYSVGRYGVDVGSIEDVAIPALLNATRNQDILVIDEIGKMELLSASFGGAVLEALESGKKVLGTIMLGSHPWADRFKERPDVEIIPVTRSNHVEVIDKIMDWLKS